MVERFWPRQAGNRESGHTRSGIRRVPDVGSSEPRTIYRVICAPRGDCTPRRDTTIQPSCFLSDQENADYDAAPRSSSSRTWNEQFAVLLYNRVDGALRNGYHVDQITYELNSYKDAIMKYMYEKPQPSYFLSHQENADYDAAPRSSSSRTWNEQFAVLLYGKVEEDIKSRMYAFPAIEQKNVAIKET